MKLYVLWVNAGDDCWLVGVFSTIEKVLARAETYKIEEKSLKSDYWRDLDITELELDGLEKPDFCKSIAFDWHGERAVLKAAHESKHWCGGFMETRMPLTHICSRCGHAEADSPETEIGTGLYRYAVDFKRVSGEGLDHWGWIGKAVGLGAAFNAALDHLIEMMPQEATHFQVSRVLNLSLPLSERT